MVKPRLTHPVIEGLRFVLMDAEAMLSERQGWGEENPDDDFEERALLYLGQLLEWADARHAIRCKKRRCLIAKPSPSQLTSSTTTKSYSSTT